ncbi:ribonuclease T2-like [Rhizoclosmatium sp. JEL0117]|nr:ribonuclease T2-like [Rhizoclosmatium sp. JEL0117]
MSCPSYAVGCQLNPVTNAKYDACCVSDSVFVFAQNYSIGLTYRTASPAWTKNSVAAAIGPKFTMHGLWADHCDGSYETTKWTNQALGLANGTNYDLFGCDASRAFQNAQQVIAADCNNAYLNTWIDTFWRAGDGDNNWLVAHEWSKHGTCTGSFGNACYPGQGPFAGFFDFLKVSLAVYQQLDIMAAFNNAGIFPSDVNTYTLAQLVAAHKTAFGAPGAMQCQGNTGKGVGPQYLSEVWTYLQEVPNKRYVPFDANTIGPKVVYNSCNDSIPIIIPVTPSPLNKF